MVALVQNAYELQMHRLGAGNASFNRLFLEVDSVSLEAT